MRAFKVVRAFVLTCSVVLLISASAALFSRDKDHNLRLRPESSRSEGSWDLDLDAYRSQRRHGLQIEIREKQSTYIFSLPSERAPVIPNARNGSPIQFVISSDAGDLKFTGEVERDLATGRYQFIPNKEFATEAGKLLKHDLNDKDLLELAWSEVTLAYIKELSAAGVALNYDDVLALRRHGLKAETVKEFAAAGVDKPREIIQLRNHGVNPNFVRKARDLAYAKSVDDVIRMRNHGVSPEYLQGWKDSGISLTADEIVRLRNHGVQAEYGAAWRKAGFNFTAEELIRSRNFGVPSDFAAALAGEGSRPNIEEVIQLRQFGVTPEFYRDVKTANPNFSSQEIVRMRQFGVPSDYVKTLMKSGARFNAEQIIALRNNGVPADYIAAVNLEGREPLDAKAIIELRQRGVSAETARKLRQ